MRSLGVVGSDPDHFECPRCGAHDRERHLLLYIRATGLFDKLHGMRVLHFAPERRLWPRIAAAPDATCPHGIRRPTGGASGGWGVPDGAGAWDHSTGMLAASLTMTALSAAMSVR